MLDKQSEVRVSRKTSYYLKVGNQPELRRVMARQPSEPNENTPLPSDVPSLLA